MSVESSDPSGATKPRLATPKIRSDQALTGTPSGFRDHSERPLRLKIASPLVHGQRGHAAVNQTRLPDGDFHCAKRPLGSRMRSRRKASIVEKPPP